ncbi:MAG: GerMN domain-containing protein [Acidobacteria bacterium]|nr:GerMN domain-containing protein [Acidobacteriota bacterium]
MIAIGLVAGLALVWWLLPKWLTTNKGVSTPNAAAVNGVNVPADTRMVKANLYFVSEDGMTLVAEPTDVPFGASPSEQARHILEAQLAPASRGRLSAIPAGVKVHAIYFTSKGDAYVDLSRDIITGHPGGSLNEALTVYTIVSALTANVREITAVQILVDGKQIDTLAGHIDLRQPLAADARWVQKGQ